MQVWNLKDDDVSILHGLETPGHRSDIRTVALSSDDSLLLSGSNNEVKIWNPRYPPPSPSAPPPPVRSVLRQKCITSDRSKSVPESLCCFFFFFFSFFGRDRYYLHKCNDSNFQEK